MRRALDAGTDAMPSDSVLRGLARDWESVDQALFAAVEARAAERYQSLITTLADRAEDDQRKIREVLEDLRQRILNELTAPTLEQCASATRRPAASSFPPPSPSSCPSVWRARYDPLAEPFPQ